MTPGRWLVWAVFALVSACLLAALVGGAWRVRAAERDADLRRASALALWRMDSVALALIAREAARPAWQYEPFGSPAAAGAPVAAERSPLLDRPAPMVVLHAWRDAEGAWRSPSAPSGPERARAIAEFGADAPIADWLIADERLSRWAPVLDGVGGSGPEATAEAFAALADVAAPERSLFAASVAASRPERLSTEWVDLPGLGGPTLVFVRSIGAVRRVAVLDWQALELRLAGAAADLLPGARVRPAREGDVYRLAALPVSLEPGEIPAGAGGVLLAAVLGAAAAGAIGCALAAVLREADRRARFAAAVTHELRTPLTALGLSLELTRSTEDADRLRELTERASAQADRLRRTGEAVLAFAGAETDRPPRMPEAVGDLLESVWPALKSTAASVGIALERPDEFDPALRVRLSGPRLERALANLIENAGRHGRGPATVTVRATTRRVFIGVADRGGGVPERERRRVLRPFERGRGAHPGGGVGLGLAIAGDAVRGAGGRLRVRERPGGGAWFELDMPRAPDAPGTG